MRLYQVWADRVLYQDNIASLALALHTAYAAADQASEGVADVYQGSRFVATVDVSLMDAEESDGEALCAA